MKFQTKSKTNHTTDVPAPSEPNNQQTTQAATGALAELLDLDFGPVQQTNDRQYILEQQGCSAASVSASEVKTYSTREPLRPSIEAKYR